MGGCLAVDRFGLCDCPEAGDAGRRKFRVDFYKGPRYRKSGTVFTRKLTGSVRKSAD
jgi:hypothetical protein